MLRGLLQLRSVERRRACATVVDPMEGRHEGKRSGIEPTGGGHGDSITLEPE